MPNGGPDNCGTCWFNRANRGKAGHGHHDPSIKSYCEIRDLRIHDPFYTYCSNHPRRLGERLPVPIGPVFVGWDREVWVESPDTEEIRTSLLRLLTDHDAMRGPQPHFFPPITGIVVNQLAELREPRAIPILERFKQEFADKPSTVELICDAIERIRGS